MKTEVSILLDSTISGIRVTTFELYYPRIIHSEFMTHRVFSRNAASSRAIPTKRMALEHVGYIPNTWRKNAKGMSPKGVIDLVPSIESRKIWEDLMAYTIAATDKLQELGVAKEIANRPLEPFSYIKVLVTATNWDNFFKLRTAPSAQEEMRELASLMLSVYTESKPRKRFMHIPYSDQVSEYGFIESFLDNFIPDDLSIGLQISVARSARVSYFSHKEKKIDIEEDINLYSLLATEEHHSPFEHQILDYEFYLAIHDRMGWPLLPDNELHGNLTRGVVQYRKILENSFS